MNASFRRLQAQLGDVALVRVAPMEARTVVLDTRPRVFAWLGGDPAAGLATITALRAARSDARLVFLTPRGAEAKRIVTTLSGC